MMNSSDSLLYNLSYLSSVIHPVIILRLLEHRLFTPLFKKKSILSNPPPVSNPLPTSESRNANSSMAPNIGASAIASIPTLPKPDQLKRQRNSLTKENQSSTINDRSSLLNKFTQSTYDKHRKASKHGLVNSSLTGSMQTNSQMSTNNNQQITSATSSTGTNATDLSLLLTSGTSSSTTNVGSSNQPSTARKWFWRYSDKNAQSYVPNDRNPLLKAIAEGDTLATKTNSDLTLNQTAGGAGAGEIKLLEKELLNLPSFQLSDSQNPLLPSPTCLSYDFPTPFDQTNSSASYSRQYSSPSPSSNTRVQQSNNSTKGSCKSRPSDDDCK